MGLGVQDIFYVLFWRADLEGSLTVIILSLRDYRSQTARAGIKPSARAAINW